MRVTNHARDRLEDCGLRPNLLVRHLVKLHLADGRHPYNIEGTGEIQFVVKDDALITVLRPIRA